MWRKWLSRACRQGKVRQARPGLGQDRTGPIQEGDSVKNSELQNGSTPMVSHPDQTMKHGSGACVCVISNRHFDACICSALYSQLFLDIGIGRRIRD